MKFDLMTRDSVTASLAGSMTIIDLHNPQAFTLTFQRSTTVATPDYMSYDDLVIAFEATTQLFEQFPVDNRNVNALIKAIFVDDEAMLKAPVVATVDSKLYGVGGRHRLAAIGRYFTHIIKENYHTNKEVGVALASKQLIRVELLAVDSTDTLLKLVEADNQSRVMRKPELQHLELQKLGGDSFGTESIAQTILNNDLTPQQAKRLSGQFFSRRSHPKLKTVTRNSIGEMVGCYVLYKLTPSEIRKLAKDATPRVNVEQFNDEMTRAWEILCDIVTTETVLGRNARSLADEVISQLDSRQQRNRSRRQRSTSVVDIATEQLEKMF